jgi:DNA helicase-2/ATP-dependent DNA helicase PcrA
MDYLDGLNESQREAVVNTEGPTMVIAGAGSGKTRVLTFRIAHLLKQNIDPFNILALTFTNKAAKEMKERIGSIVGDNDAKNITMGTFHSVFAKILRYNAEKIGYPSNFTIYDTQDSRSLLKAIVKEAKLDDKIYKPNAVQGRISSAKNNLISPVAYLQNPEVMNEDKLSGKPMIGEVYKQYQHRLKKSGAMDFDDLLFQMNVLLRDHPNVLHHYQHKFRYIMVDEYQDTNYSQYLIVKKLAAAFQNLCVVGDDAQSIYSFRGANIENILNFKKDYPDYKVYKLEQNYRSTQNIVDAANSVIENNKNQIQKDVWTSNEPGSKIDVLRTLTDNEEGKVVANRIFDKKHSAQVEYEDFAILYRTNAQSRSFEESLRKLNIPYKIYGGLSFYQRKEIKDLLAYFRLTANPTDEEALKRVINYPKRAIGNTTIDHLIVAANEMQLPIWDIISTEKLDLVNINGGAKTKIREFSTMIKSFSILMDEKPAYDTAQHIASSSNLLKELYSDKTPEGVGRYENIQELLAGIKEFQEAAEDGAVNTLSDFLIDVALLTDADKDTEEDKNKVVLMTIHASKGLEFPYVNIVGLEENLFPSQLALNSRDELEEERRLFYVALTRAEKECTLSFATSRYRWGNLITSEQSRFIDEIDEKFLHHDTPYHNTGGGRSLNSRTRSQSTTTSSFSPPKKLKKIDNSPAPKNSPSGNSSDLSQLKVGYNVKHERFGKGKVVAIEGVKPNTKATVFFPRVGQKQLLLKFAKLEILE